MSSISSSSSSGGGATKQPSSNWLALKQKITAPTQKQQQQHKQQSKAGKGQVATKNGENNGKNSNNKSNSNNNNDSSRSGSVKSNKRKNDGKSNSNSDENDPQFKRRREIQASLNKVQKAKDDEVAAAIEASAEEAKKKKLRWKDDRYVALDCEMVGTGHMGKHSSLARCSLVNYSGDIVYDKFVRSNEFVVDFRTKYSGIRKKDLRKDNAIPLEQCQQEVAGLLKGKILVGHALKNDLLALMLKHNRGQIRDTARYRPYMRPHGRKGGKFKPRKLKELSKQFLKMTIQEGEHDSGIDARAAMMLYKFKEEEWEQFIKSQKNKSKVKVQDDSDSVAGETDDDAGEEEDSENEDDSDNEEDGDEDDDDEDGGNSGHSEDNDDDEDEDE